MKLLIDIFVVIANLFLASLLILFMYESPMSGLDRLFQYGALCLFFVNIFSTILNWVKKVRFLYVFILVISLGFIVVSCVSAGFGIRQMVKDHLSWSKQQDELNARLVGKSLCKLTSTTIDGDHWSFSNHVGKVILIDFWATWCGPCIQSMPEMKAIYKEYSSYDDFLMIGVTLDENSKEPANYCAESSIPWIQLIEDDMIWSNSIAQAFEVHGIPCVGIVDRNGEIVAANLRGKQIYRKLNEIFESQ